MAYPSTTDSLTNPAGTSTLASPDHAGLHTSVNGAIIAIETVLGTTAGTAVLKDFATGNFATRQDSSNRILDSDGNPIIKLDGGGVGNYFQVSNSSGGNVQLSAVGTTNVSMAINGNGTGKIYFFSTIGLGTANDFVLGTPSITGGTYNTPLIQNRFVAKGEYDNGNSGTAKTIDWSNGDRQRLTVNANTTLAYSNAGTGQVLAMSVDMNGTGGYSITLPTSIWPGGAAGVFGTAANAKNELVVRYDGTNYRTQLAASFA
jgi:hypothetical protein